MNKKDFDFIIDVRTLEEFAEDHIEGSINIPLDEIANDFNNIEFKNISKDKNILLVCRSGGRAGMAEMILRQKGFSNIKNGGGFSSWK
jgi:phage shock protein E